MKTIGVLVHTLTIEYSNSVINGIIDYFSGKDVKVLIAQVKGPNYELGLYEYQEWTSTKILFSQEVDGLIVLTGSFSSTSSIKGLEKALSEFPSKPIVSIAVGLNLPNVTSIVTENSQAYEKLITHMVKVHKCKNFAFLGPYPEESDEAKDRYHCFINALKKNNISFDPDLYFHGNYTTDSAEKEFSTRFHKKTDIKFDCLVAANDLMALGAKNIMSDLGVKIPEQVKIIGYDNTSHSKISHPVLTTIDQNFFRQGVEAAKLIDKKSSKKNVALEEKVFSLPLIKESCGCEYKATLVSLSSKKRNQLASNGDQGHFLSKLSRIAVLLDMSKANYTSQQIFYILKYMIENAEIEAIAVCRYTNPVILGRKDPLNLPSQATVQMYVDNSRGIEVFNKNISFNPNECVLPEEILGNQPGNYIVHPIYSGELNYGYVVCRLQTIDFAVSIVSLRIIISALSQAFEYTNQSNENKILTEENKELIQNNTNLNRQSKTDELTHLLNRRGFMELGQNNINLAMEDNVSGLVFFADLDGLKTINDKYGHKMGDAAIKAMGSVLSQILRANDIVGRLSGDEFAGVATGMGENLVAKVRKEAKELCMDISKQHEFPFTLSFSIGYAKFDSSNNSLKELLEQADKVLYEEKKIAHQAKN